MVLGIGAAVMLLPVVWLLSTSLKPPDQVYSIPMVWVPRPFEWGNYAEVFSSSPFARYLIVTGVVTGIGIFASMCGSSMAAYAFARIRFPGRQAMFGIMLATLMVPVWTLIIPTYIFFGKIGWLNSYLPILVPAFFATPFNTFLLRQFFLTIPVELEEAARMDGASRRMIFLHNNVAVVPYGVDDGGIVLVLLLLERVFVATYLHSDAESLSSVGRYCELCEFAPAKLPFADGGGRGGPVAAIGDFLCVPALVYPGDCCVGGKGMIGLLDAGSGDSMRGWLRAPEAQIGRRLVRRQGSTPTFVTHWGAGMTLV